MPLSSSLLFQHSLVYLFQALGAVDYLEIGRQFDVVLLRNIRAMDLTKRTEARRFITLIDTLYDAKVCCWWVRGRVRGIGVCDG